MLPFIYQGDDAEAEFLEDRPAMIEAYRELTERFTSGASNPAVTIRIYFYFDSWMEAMLAGL